MQHIRIAKELSGSILDLGGGGEGIVGRVYGAQVMAIDIRSEELEEAPSGSRKMVMDACALTFCEATFDNVTAFYFFMYLDKARHKEAIREAYRVLKPGGQMIIWDTEIDAAWPEPFITELQVDADGTPVQVTYGVGKDNASQNADWLEGLLIAAGFQKHSRVESQGHFQLCFAK